MTNIKWSNKELKEHMEACSSVKKVINHPMGVTYVYKPRAILQDNGSPVSLEMFLKLTGQRNLVQKRDFSKTEAEKRMLKAAKEDYNKAMFELLGPKWKSISRQYRIYNVPENPETRHEVKQLAKNYYL